MGIRIEAIQGQDTDPLICPVTRRLPIAHPSFTETIMARRKKPGVYKLESVMEELRKRRRTAGDLFAKTSVGYTAPHAVPVHERLDVHHPQGQAKFLEQPLRTEQRKMAAIIRSRLRARESLKAAQLEAAKHLMKVSLVLVPVDTGELRNSWFIR